MEEALNERNQHFDLCVLEEYPDQSFTFFESSPRILFHKKGNPPLVVVAASLEASADGIDPNPFRSRFIRLRFSSQIPDLDEGRLIATLWGCVRRRVCYSPYAFFSTTPNDLCLDYRDSEGYFIPDDLDPEKRSFQKMCMDRYMGFALSAGETLVTYKSLKGILYTKQGKCLEYKAVRLEKVIGDINFYRSAILLNMRGEWQSYCFKAFNEKELPSLSILDFAVIPLKKPRRPRVDEKNQDEGRRTFNLFTNNNLSCNRVETRFSPEEEEKISWQLQLLGHPKNIHLLNVWRSQDPNQGDYATWPLEMSFEGIQKYEETPTMSGKGLPIVLKLDNEHEQTERDWEGYEELLAAEQERAQSGQLRPYSIRFAHSGDNECWGTYEGR